MQLFIRKYGEKPFRTAVIHGGPGAAGEMAPVARSLCHITGILEPLQRATSLEGQIEELNEQLGKYADLPVCLIGYSWGAWLSIMVAARYPAHIRKIILVSSGPFDEKYTGELQQTRLSRLSQNEQKEYLQIIDDLRIEGQPDRDKLLARLGELAIKTDSYDVQKQRPDKLLTNTENARIYQAVWHEAQKERQTGRLIERAAGVKCPIVAIHGNYDPHPADGVNIPLARVVKDFHFYLLKNCGHKPWVEKQAGESFFRVLRSELKGI